MARSLYICYLGVCEPLVQTQVIPYLRELVKGGHEISLLTFEPALQDKEKDRKGEGEIKKGLAEHGIDWHWLKYHKRFSIAATAWDVSLGILFIRRFIRQYKPDILHARVHVPALMAAIARKLTRHKPKLLFDIRGFMPEEYTDAGVWPENGWLYRTAKRIEKLIFTESDGFVVLTENARSILFPESGDSGVDKLGRPVEVIPCCVDFSRFLEVSEVARTEARTRLGVRKRPVIAYVGSFGGWYLSEEMMHFFAASKKCDPNVFILILTQREQEGVRANLSRLGFEDTDFRVESVAPKDVPLYLAAADLAISFIKPCYSKRSSSPTKLAEYLACGVPIISNRGVGDVDALITDNNVGVLVDGFDESDYLQAMENANKLGIIRERCRQVSEKEFDLSFVAGNRYRRLYERLSSAPRHESQT